MGRLQGLVLGGALVSSDTTAQTGPFAAPVVGAVAANRPFLLASSGFVGAPSDGLTQLDTYHYLRSVYRSAIAGNVVQTAQIDHPTRPFTLALGFGSTATAAVNTPAHRGNPVRHHIEPIPERLARL